MLYGEYMQGIVKGEKNILYINMISFQMSGRTISETVASRSSSPL